MWRIVTAFLYFSFVFADENNWWKNAHIYEIFVPAFKDSNGDGIGDLQGIITKQDYFTKLGIDAVWLSPIFQSPMKNAGYDTSNYTTIDPLFGTMERFQRLVREFKSRGIKVIIDLVINHSSDDHPWFKNSASKIEPYTDYYVWKDPKSYDSQGTPLPPNNWLTDSWPKISAWTWNKERKQFYYHKFSENQPDLNLRNKNLIEEIEKIINFWLAQGVNGIRFDSASYFIEDALFRDEPIDKKVMFGTDFEDRQHIYTQNQQETYELIKDLRKCVNEINNVKEGYERILITEVSGNLKETTAYYGSETQKLSDISFNFDYTIPMDYYSSKALDGKIKTILNTFSAKKTPYWLFDNRDFPWVFIPKFHENYVDLMNMIVMLLPGICITSYGQEIGMISAPAKTYQKTELMKMPRKPMQWMDTMNAGFTAKSHSWLVIDPSYSRINVQREEEQTESNFHVFRILSQIRKTEAIKRGDFQSYIISPWVYVFTRKLQGHEVYITVLNLGSETEIVNLHEEIQYLPLDLKVTVASVNAGYKMGDVIKKKSEFPQLFVMRPLSAVVLSAQLKPVSGNENTHLINWLRRF